VYQTINSQHKNIFKSLLWKSNFNGSHNREWKWSHRYESNHIELACSNDTIHIHPLVTIISKTFHFRFIQLRMYMVFIIDYIHHLINESKMQSFAYNSDRRV